ncbi:hypothetical protein [Falsiroseomonas sp.]|uniref:hypothetical protein n=1 Tax=Falsiroseomonas sp. TaxID=2870721 RepID=UPI0034A2B331
MTDLTPDALVEDVARAIANKTRIKPVRGDAYDCLRSWACPDGPESGEPSARAEWRLLHDMARAAVAAVAKRTLASNADEARVLLHTTLPVAALLRTLAEAARHD